MPVVENFEIFIAVLFVSVAGLNVLARWVDVPYPIPLVLGGLALGLVPGMPEIELEPDLVLLVFLPPLLYSAAFFSDLRALRRDLRAISMLSIGLVLATMGTVAVLGHEVIGLSWPMAFALGAIVSPTDPVAATAIMRRLGAPRRLVNVIEGESLVNDATALVALPGRCRGCRRAAASPPSTRGWSSWGQRPAASPWDWRSRYVVAEIRRRVEDSLTEITISLLTAYAAFIPADELGLSGVLAAVTAGVYLGWRAPELTTPQTRLQSFAVWEILVFLLNASLFILIGLQLPVIVDGLDGRGAGELIGYSALVCAAVIGVRFAWMFTMPYVIRAARSPACSSARGAWERASASWSRGRASAAPSRWPPPWPCRSRPTPGRRFPIATWSCSSRSW